MTEIVKVDVIPTSAKPVEGVDYNVIAGSPEQGDKVRISTQRGAVIFESCYTPPSAPAQAVLQWDAFDFKNRFTPQERIAIRAAAKSDASVEDFMDMLDTAGMTGTMIKADDALLNVALKALEDAELIAEGRKAEILGT